MFLIQLSGVGSSSLEMWLLETKCAKMTFGNRVIQIFSCKFESTCGGHHLKKKKVHFPVEFLPSLISAIMSEQTAAEC